MTSNSNDHHHHRVVLQVATDTWPPTPFYIDRDQVRTVCPIGSRSPEFEARGFLEVLYVEGVGNRPARALTTLDWLAQSLGWFGYEHNRPIAEAYRDRPFAPERAGFVAHPVLEPEVAALASPVKPVLEPEVVAVMTTTSDRLAEMLDKVLELRALVTALKMSKRDAEAKIRAKERKRKVATSPRQANPEPAPAAAEVTATTPAEVAAFTAAERFRALTGFRLRKLNLSVRHNSQFRKDLARAMTGEQARAAYGVARSRHIAA